MKKYFLILFSCFTSQIVISQESLPSDIYPAKDPSLFTSENVALKSDPDGFETGGSGANNNDSFALRETTQLGSSSPSAVAFGDVDGDGDLELVAVTSSNADVENDYSIFVFNPTTDGLGEAVRMSYGAQAEKNGIEIVDLDEDGASEIIVGHGSGISIFSSDGAGGFDMQLVTSGEAEVLASTDINQDGNVDIVGITSVDRANFYFGDGNKNISSVGGFFINTLGGNDLAVGDFDDDGFEDLLVMSGEGDVPNFNIHFHDGVNAFEAEPSVFFADVGQNSGGVGVGDIDGDGRHDIVLSRRAEVPTSIWSYIQGDNGQLSGPSSTDSSFGNPEPVTVLDLNNDGYDDALVLHSGGEAMTSYMGSIAGMGGGGMLQIPLSTNYGKESIAGGDIDNDGCPELIVIADGDNGLLSVRNKNCFSSGGGAFDFSFLLLLLAPLFRQRKADSI
ncbi:FG-GAP repeat domain-containing protein [Pleionea sediminis]|uniref:FG-GAP repeat domain-containing protein n=1 Tax=Pleionea sediminis TaxID=2569479 RepID=UPI0011856EE4|nr:VCBS repeat-containing protein [Pleionea sediminis]